MNVTLDPVILDYVLQGLKLAGITSFAALISLYAAWLAFFPELTVDSVIDKSKKLNSESRIKIKNLGKLPALDVSTVVTELNVTLDGLSMRNCAILAAPPIIPRLAGGESSEIAIAPGIHTQQGANFSTFEYNLELTYAAKFLFFSRRLTKCWRVSLRTLGEEFAWTCSIVG